MNHRILVYRDCQPQEDGSVHRPWVASSVDHHAAAEGRSPDAALADFCRWLLIADDSNDERSAPLHAKRAVEPAPLAAPPAKNSPHDHVYARFVDALPDDTYVVMTPADEHLYAETPRALVDRFESAQPYEGPVPIPEGWTVRVASEGEG